MAGGDPGRGVPIRLLVADRYPLLRLSLVAAFRATPDFDVVAETGDGPAALTGVARLDPDVALIDTGLHTRSGLQVCAAAKAASPRIRVVVIHDVPDGGVLLAAVEAGADGFVTRQQPLRDVVAAIHDVHRDEASIPAPMLRPLLKDLVSRGREESAVWRRLSRLSRREKQVLRLLSEGMDHKAMADILVLSPHTARTHIQHLLEKLEVHSRVDAVALAITYHLLDHTDSDGT